MLSSLKRELSGFLKPLTKLIAKSGINPNVLTIAGFLLGLLSAYFIAFGDKIQALLMVAVASFFDLLDGALARNEGMKTARGGFLDSVFDRYVDSAMILALGIRIDEILLSAIALIGAYMVSYTRARAEKEVERCDVGIAERGERLLIILAGIALSLEYYALILLAVLSHITAIHRIVYAYVKIKERESK